MAAGVLALSSLYKWFYLPEHPKVADIPVFNWLPNQGMYLSSGVSVSQTFSVRR